MSIHFPPRKELPMSTATAPPGRIDVVQDEVDKVRGLGDFLKHVALAEDNLHARSAVERLEKVYKSTRAMGLGATAGGYTVPAGFSAAFLKSAGETSIVRPRALTLPMDALEVDVPVLNQTTAPTAGNTPYGGLNLGWTADGAETTAADPSFHMVKLTAHDLTGYVEVSKALLSASPAMAAGLLVKLFGDSVAWTEDQVFLGPLGTGMGRPLSVLNAPARVTTAARGGAAALTHGDYRLLLASLLPSSRDRAVLIVSQAAEDDLLGMTADTDTGAASSVFGRVTSHFDAATGRARLFLGRTEILSSEHLPALNTVGDVMLVDLSRHYLIGTRTSMEVSYSAHHKFRHGQGAFRLVHQVGALPLLSGPITLSDATTSASFAAALGAA
jgi:HK97 family phage major capsid protein